MLLIRRKCDWRIIRFVLDSLDESEKGGCREGLCPFTAHPAKEKRPFFELQAGAHPETREFPSPSDGGGQGWGWELLGISTPSILIPLIPTLSH